MDEQEVPFKELIENVRLALQESLSDSHLSLSQINEAFFGSRPEKPSPSLENEPPFEGWWDQLYSDLTDLGRIAQHINTEILHLRRKFGIDG